MQKNTGLIRLLYAMTYSISGLNAAIRYEAAFRQAFVALIVLTLLSFFLDVTAIEQVLMVGSLVMVLIFELLNSAIECLADCITTAWDPLIKRAKDYGSLAVLLAILISVAVWLVILLPTSGL